MHLGAPCPIKLLIPAKCVYRQVQKPHFQTGAYTNFMQNFALTVFNARSSVMIYEMHTRPAREEPSDRVSHHD